MLKKCLFALLYWVDRCLQACIPPAADRLCYASLPDYNDNAYYVFRHALITRDHLEHIWLIGGKDTDIERIRDDFRALCDKHGTTGNRLITVRKYSLRGYWLFMTSRAAFHTYGLYRFARSHSRNRTRFSLWHGMPIKCIGHLNRISTNPIPIYGDRHLANSHFFKYVIAQAFAVNSRDVLVCSAPRCDVLLDSDDNRSLAAQARERLPFKVNRHLLLWLPTYRSEPTSTPTHKIQLHSFLDDIGESTLQELDELAGKLNITVVIKLHVYDRLNELEWLHQFANIQLLRANDLAKLKIELYPLLAAADGLLSDISSVMIDYLLTSKPIGVLGFDESTYPRETVFPPQLLLNSTRIRTIDNNSELGEFLEQISAGQSLQHAPEDIANIFYETFDEPGSEAVLRESGF